MQLLERAEGGGQKVDADRRAGTDAQVAALDATQLLELQRGFVEDVEGTARVSVEDRPRLGELHAFAESIQQRHSENEAANKRRAKGLSTARERVEMLVDEGTFVELDLFATHRAYGFGMEDRRIAGDGVVAGFGEIDRRPVAVYAYDATVYGGSLGEVTAEKIVKVQELALRNRVPIIGINDSGGARIQEGVVALAGYADIFYRNVRSSGVIP